MCLLSAGGGGAASRGGGGGGALQWIKGYPSTGQGNVDITVGAGGTSGGAGANSIVVLDGTQLVLAGGGASGGGTRTGGTRSTVASGFESANGGNGGNGGVANPQRSGG
jgi:hypothetical protein